MILKSGTLINDDMFQLLWASLRRALVNDYESFAIFMSVCNSSVSVHRLPAETKAVLAKLKLDPSGLLKEVAREFVVNVDGKFFLKDPGLNILQKAETGLLLDFFSRNKSTKSETGLDHSTTIPKP